MTLAEHRKALSENATAYLPNGLKCQFAGYMQPVATVTSKAPGGYNCLWSTVEAVLSRPDRRFKVSELSVSNLPWGGLPVEPSDFQTEEDYQRYVRANP